jgi:hypothetical protein
MIIAVRVKLIDVIKPFGHLVISFYPLRAGGTALLAYFIRFEEFVRLLAVSLLPILRAGGHI